MKLLSNGLFFFYPSGIVGPRFCSLVYSDINYLFFRRMHSAHWHSVINNRTLIPSYLSPILECFPQPDAAGDLVFNTANSLLQRLERTDS